MIIFAEARIPYGYARDVCMTTSRASLLDVNAMAKNAVADLLFDGALRPWRLTGSPAGGHRDESIHIQGIVNDKARANDLTEALGQCGGSLKVTEWDVKTGDVVLCDVVASPRRAATMRNAAGAPRRVELSPIKEGETAKEAYMRWLTRKFAEPRVGATAAASDIIILSTRDERHVVDKKVIQTPCVRALVTFEVTDADAFRGFLRAGVGPLKHVGFGSILPQEIACD